MIFLLAPPREGRPLFLGNEKSKDTYFYSRPHGKGDRRHFLLYGGRLISTRAPTGRATHLPSGAVSAILYFYSRPHGKGDSECSVDDVVERISTRAPTGRATAIFHKVDAVFCGELPKDHAVFYEIFPVCQRNLSKSRENQKNFCADLPRNYVREGSALEDQGASGFYERLFSHGLDPILIGIAQPIEADGVLLQVNDLFQFIF